jgi:CRISPR-associated protein Cmr4
MFERREAVFIYCVSPVHMGAGTAIGAIDNPIQRERHSLHPIMAGSGLKGALRHHALQSGWRDQRDLLFEVFGPDTGQAEHAGALSMGEAQIVLFPVRSLRQSFVYATSPMALGRLVRLLDLAGVTAAKSWVIPQPADDACELSRTNAADEVRALRVNSAVILDSFQFQITANEGRAGPIARWLADNALPQAPAFAYFREKVREHLVVLSNDRFDYFVRNATFVEPHVRIDDSTGAAQEGGLFYTENLPPESLLVSLLMASRGRRNGKARSADEICQAVREGVNGASGFDGQLVQVGGDATTGRGQVMLRFAGEIA